MVRNLGKKLKNMGEIKQGSQHPEKNERSHRHEGVKSIHSYNYQ